MQGGRGRKEKEKREKRGPSSPFENPGKVAVANYLEALEEVVGITGLEELEEKEKEEEEKEGGKVEVRKTTQDGEKKKKKVGPFLESPPRVQRVIPWRTREGGGGGECRVKESG